MSDVVEAQTVKRYNLTTAEKAEQMGVSISYLNKDRLKAVPDVPFKKWGSRVVRYAAED